GTWNDVTHFWSSDLQHWQSEVVVRQDPGEHLFNTSACAGLEGFALAYETDDPAYPPFSVKYATSPDLRRWERLEGVVFGTNRYTACPCLRWADGYYYQLYLEHRRPRWQFETYIARSPDLRRWELSPANPVLAPEGLDEGTNTSDPELIEVDGVTWLYYAVGDQRTWMKVKRARFAGPQGVFLAHWFRTGGIPDLAVAGPT
ncbi:MAG: hypothetical protein IT369_08160, partial [Candidatus Latescibacteria bacterium]|nr:hypothetical protein [Candidatus Latescibacterota bacterium]